ncbi:MAG: multiple sugar transport system permease protein [Frankiaceae bacterium]|jgi:multiple sugar transport system permease protein|nr:multiple sugar transport system permease protein [Frankiaceae bacterium]
MSIDTRPAVAQPSGNPPPADAPGRRGRKSAKLEKTAGIVSETDWQSPRVRRRLGIVHGIMLFLLLLWGLVPLIWLAKAAVTPTQETLRHPINVWPRHFAFANISTAWTTVRLGVYFKNTIVIALGSWLAQLVVATTAGYGLSVLKPKYAKVLNALVVSTLFIPAVVLLVPLYLTVIKVPFVHWRLIDSYWAIWLPAGANAFNVLLIKRFFDSLPRELFEAARVDGAGPFRLFWSIVLPLSRPILGVVSVFAFIAAWKDFLWPLLVLSSNVVDKQPLSVRLPALAPTVDLGVLMAALFISTLLPIVLFIIFQRVFLRSSGLSGAIKG